MPIVGLPDFTNGILTAAQLNTISRVLQEKFAGQLGPGDMAWPLVCSGDINLGRHSLLNVGRLWNQYNLAERASGATVQSVIDSLASDGGGVIIIPGNTVVTVEAGGLTLADNIIFVGHGDSSVLAINASASTDMFTISGTADNCGFYNMTLRGATGVDHSIITGSSDVGLRLVDVTLENHGTSPMLDMTSSSNLMLDRCTFTGEGAAEANTMLSLNLVTNSRIVNCTFNNWSDVALNLTDCTNVIIGDCALDRNADNDVMTSAWSILLDGVSNVLINDIQLGASSSSSTIKGFKLLDCNGVVINDSTLSTISTAILADESQALTICGNNISAGVDGIVLGCDTDTSTAVGSRVASLVSNGYVISDNRITAQTCGIALVHIGSGAGLYATVTGNRVSALTAACSVWNCGASTTLTFRTTITGNSFHDGFKSYEGMGPGSNRGARIGLNNNAFWVFVGNISPNTLIGATASYDMEDSSADESAVASNVV